MISELRTSFPDIPDPILWKVELLFRGVRFTEELADAAREGAAPNFWPYRKKDSSGSVQTIPVPYLFRLETGEVARVRVDDNSSLQVRRKAPGSAFELCDGDTPLCAIQFVQSHAWQSQRLKDGSTLFSAGVEQLGDMLVVNVAPGCEYFRVKDAAGHSMRCGYCAYGRIDQRSQMFGQQEGKVAVDASMLAKLGEALTIALAGSEARHIYVTGGSLLSPEDEARRFAPVIEVVRRAAGDRVRVTCGSGAVRKQDSQRYRDAGADSCCYNLEVWDPDTFRAVCPGKDHYVGRDTWIEALIGATEVFGRGNVGSAFVAGVEMRPPAPVMTADQMLASITEGAGFLLDRGIVPLYSPLWPVEGTVYGTDDGISPELFLELQRRTLKMRQARAFPVPAWLICRGCSYMLMEVDFDHAFQLRPAVSA